MTAAFWIDLLVVLAYFGAVMTIGLSQRSKSGSMEGFALGDRQIAWWAVLASILAAEISAGTFFGTPGEGYQLRNYTYVQLIFGYVLARVVVSAVFIPAFYRHNVVSIYEFLETRFGTTTRRAASAVFLVTRVLASGTRLWVPTILMVLMWELAHPGQDISAWGEFGLYAVALVGITIMTAVYTAHGGIRAVIWTDVIQIVVLFSALGFSLWFLLHHVEGGWQGMVNLVTAKDGDQALKLVSWHGDAAAEAMAAGHHVGLWGQIKSVLETEYTMWAALIGSTFVTLATHGTDQDMVQRMLTAKNKRESGFATILSGIIDIPVVLAVLTIGILLWTHYQQQPDPLLPGYAAGKVAANKVFPWFILTEMPQGLRGLVIAGVLATAMGSLGTAINALATSYVRDFHFRWFGEPTEERGRVRALRVGSVLFATLLVLVGLATAWITTMNPELRIIPIILGIFGYTYGSLLGIFLVGLFTKRRGNDRGNLIAMGVGFFVVAFLSGLDQSIASLWNGTGMWRPDWMPVIEFVWRIFFGSVATVAVALCFSTPVEKQEANG